MLKCIAAYHKQMRGMTLAEAVVAEMASQLMAIRLRRASLGVAWLAKLILRGIGGGVAMAAGEAVNDGGVFNPGVAAA